MSLNTIGLFFVCTTVLYAWYLFAMYLMRRKHMLRRGWRLPIYYVAVFFAVLLFPIDPLYNLVFGSIVFRQWPRLNKGEWTLSQRMSGLNETGKGWRKMWAEWICTSLLNDYDPSGHHC